MAVNNPYGVKAVTDEQAVLMRGYTPSCVKLIEGCQHIPEVGAASAFLYRRGVISFGGREWASG